MQALAGEIGDGCLTPSITTPAFVRYTRENVERRTSTSAARSSRRSTTTATKGRDGAREIAGMYLANKVQNIQGAADTLLDLAGLEQDEIRPVAEAMERGGRLAAKAEVTDAHPRQVQADRRHAGRLHRGDRGVQGRRLHARHARALGRGPARADRAVRRAKCSRTSVRERDHRPRPPGRLGEPGDRDAELHRLRGCDGRADGGDLRGHGPARPVAAGRGRPRERARDPRGHRRRRRR